MWPLRLHTIQARPVVEGFKDLTHSKKKIRVSVFINNISAERFLDITRPLPPVKISTNLNLIGIDKSKDDLLEVPFVFTISYNPSVAQISVKGKAHVTAREGELKEILASYREKKVPSPVIVQTISNVVFLESVLISRTLNIPPPVPLPKVPLKNLGKKRAEPTYRA